MAVLPSAESATEAPCRALPTAPEPTSLGPCCIQTPPLLVQIHAAPTALRQQGAPEVLSALPPMMAVAPSAESATDAPWAALPTAPEPTSFPPCCVQTPPVLVQIHAAPAKLSSQGPLTMAVLPSAESETCQP